MELLTIWIKSRMPFIPKSHKWISKIPWGTLQAFSNLTCLLSHRWQLKELDLQPGPIVSSVLYLPIRICTWETHILLVNFSLKKKSRWIISDLLSQAMSFLSNIGKSTPKWPEGNLTAFEWSIRHEPPAADVCKHAYGARRWKSPSQKLGKPVGSCPPGVLGRTGHQSRARCSVLKGFSCYILSDSWQDPRAAR